MTVIAYKDGVMASDGQTFSGGMRFSAMHMKVIRCNVGLVGAAGRQSDGALFRQWMVAGMNRAELPQFAGDQDEPVQGLWAKEDGTLWFTDERLAFNEIEAPGTIGESAASAFVEGAMRAGASAEEAVRLAIRHCTYVGGEIQVVSFK